ncbi:MAG: transglycosylase SLT domain-containing protein [Desulfosarcina sp.]
MVHKLVTIGILIASALFGLVPSPAHAVDDPFPRYEVIDPNVSFWTDIYARYSTKQAVVHDSVHLDIVYDVIDLRPREYPGARKINRKRMKQARQRYVRILKRLSADPHTKDSSCRRVAKMFGDQVSAGTFSRARHRVRCQIGQRDRFRSGIIRSGAYIDQMRAILRAKGVPEDLAYLPHVESSFNTNAYSKFGAAGMWQFTRSTGKRFMTVNYVLDERRDPITATRAAACLLKENYDKLGSWPLAITAYNHGAAGMMRAKAAHGSYPAIFTAYRGRTFKFASRNFYSEFLAARQVAANHQHYFGPLALNRPTRTQSVRMNGYAALVDLCRHFKTSPQAIRAMNPALRPPVFNGQKYIPKGYVLNLPAHVSADIPVLANVPSEIYKNKQKPSRFYTVRRGDTAGKIARMHRVRLNDLILANNLDRRATVYVRQTLRIPQAGEATRQPEKRQPPKPKTPTVLTAAADLGVTTAALLSIVPAETSALRYRRPGPAPAELLAMTDVPVADPSTMMAVAPVAVTESSVVNADIQFDRLFTLNQQPMGIIRVEVEETLGHYAEWAGVRASRIRRLNNLPFGQALHLHQEVKIPLERVGAEAFETQRYEFHKRLQEDFYAAYRVGELQRYRVQPGDSYWTLCREKFDLPLWLLRHYNTEVDLADLRIHQSLTIPAIESIAENRMDEADGMTTPDA